MLLNNCELEYTRPVELESERVENEVVIHHVTRRRSHLLTHKKIAVEGYTRVATGCRWPRKETVMAAPIANKQLVLKDGLPKEEKKI